MARVMAFGQTPSHVLTPDNAALRSYWPTSAIDDMSTRWRRIRDGNGVGYFSEHRAQAR